MKIAIDIPTPRVRELANNIREITSDEMIKFLENTSDIDVVKMAVEYCVNKTDRVVIEFPRRKRNL